MDIVQLRWFVVTKWLYKFLAFPREAFILVFFNKLPFFRPHINVGQGAAGGRSV